MLTYVELALIFPVAVAVVFGAVALWIIRETLR